MDAYACRDDHGKDDDVSPPFSELLFAAPLLVPRLIRALSLPAPPEEPVRLGAASAITLFNDTVFIAADDQLHLAVIEGRGEGASSWIKLLPGELPAEPKARKAVKPDFEALLQLPSINAVVALPSASTARRMKAAVVELGSRAVRTVDLTAFYESLDVPVLNLEGACLVGERLFLLQRGSAVAPQSLLIELSGGDFTSLLTGSRPTTTVTKHPFNLPALDGVRLAPTDLIALDDGRMLFTAAAEAAPNAYEDGPTVGSCIGVVDLRGNVLQLDRVETPGLKLEGIAIAERGGLLKLLAVADQDDPTADGCLYELALQLCSACPEV